MAETTPPDTTGRAQRAEPDTTGRAQRAQMDIETYKGLLSSTAAGLLRSFRFLRQF
jgi:hypothetical protein